MTNDGRQWIRGGDLLPYVVEMSIRGTHRLCRQLAPVLSVVRLCDLQMTFGIRAGFVGFRPILYHTSEPNGLGRFDSAWVIANLRGARLVRFVIRRTRQVAGYATVGVRCPGTLTV